MSPTIIDEILGVTLSLGAVTFGAYSFFQGRYRAQTLERAGYCSRCAGEGQIECTLCYGRGSIAQPGYVNVADPYNRSQCKRCGGSGKHECRVCSGSGKAGWVGNNIQSPAVRAQQQQAPPSVVSQPLTASQRTPMAPPPTVQFYDTFTTADLNEWRDLQQRLAEYERASTSPSTEPGLDSTGSWEESGKATDWGTSQQLGGEQPRIESGFGSSDSGRGFRSSDSGFTSSSDPLDFD